MAPLSLANLHQLELLREAEGGCTLAKSNMFSSDVSFVIIHAIRLYGDNP